ncbi:MAG TPA: sugar phosphate isomerase/epimerase [Steroidobacteraceae bacterium]|nr:sugar phosphate isomerase/epimerase [Steroidobacteraceae bacterium]
MVRAAQPDVALCWGTVIGTPLETLVDAAGRAGIAAVTLTSGMYADARARGASDSELRSRLAGQGVRVHAIDPLIGALPGTPRPEDVPPENRCYFEFTEADCYRAAHALGAETINLAHFGGGAVSEAAFIDCIGGIAARAQREGVRLTLEFLPESAIPDLATAQRIVVGVGASNLGVMLDTWHFARTGGTVEALGALSRGVISALQISDRREPPPGTKYTPMFGRLLPGEGELPLVAILRLLLERDRTLTVGVEVFSEELQELPPDEVARRVARATGRVLAQATASRGREA